MEFQVANTKDLDRVASILKDEELCYDDLHSFEGEIVQVFDNHGTLAGFYGLELCGEDAILRSVVVIDGQRSKGLGTIIAKHAIKKGREQNLRDLYLLTTTAAPFFARQGFLETERAAVPSAVGSTREFIDFCPDTAVCMKLSLTR